MHKLIPLLVLSAANGSRHETPGRSVRHFRLHPGRIQEARDEALRAARLNVHLHLRIY